MNRSEELREKISDVEEAQELIERAIELLESVVRGTEQENHFNAYVISKLKIINSSDSGYCTNDPNLDELIEDLRIETMESESD